MKIQFIGRKEGVSTYQLNAHYIHASNKQAALKRIEGGGFGELNFHGTSADLYQSDSHTVCYRTGTEESGCLHVTASEQNMKRLMRAIKAGA